MSAVYWFEIPVSDIERAITFYNELLGAEMQSMDLTETQGTIVAMIPDRGGAGGMLVQGLEHGYIPSHEGSLVYLDLDGKLEDTLAKVEPAGGSILLPKTSLGEFGWTAWIEDTEGNRIGLRTAE